MTIVKGTLGLPVEFDIDLPAGTGGSGADGADGVKGDTGLQGEQGVQGLQGEQGVPGEQGEQGIPGEQGIQGLQGIPGTSTGGGGGAVGPEVLVGPGGLQAAIDSLPEVGGTLVVPGGVHLLDPATFPLRVDGKSVLIRGMIKDVTRFQVTGGYAAKEAIFRLGETHKVPYFGMRDLTIDGNKDAQGGENRRGIRFFQVKHAKFQDMRWTNIRGEALFSEWNSDVERLEAIGSEFDNDHALGGAIFTQNAGMVVIDDCWFHDLWTRGCMIRENSANNLTNTKSGAIVKNSLWERLGRSGVNGRLETMVAGGAMISGNLLRDTPGSPTHNLYPCKGNEIVTGNTMINFGQGIVFNHATGEDNVGGGIASHNLIIFSGHSGISLWDVNGCTISHNIIRNSQRGAILVRGSDTTVDGNTLQNNGQENGHNYGVHLLHRRDTIPCLRNAITNNKFYDDQDTPTQTVGVREEQTGAGTTDFNEVYNNLFGAGIATGHEKVGGAGANTVFTAR